MEIATARPHTRTTLAMLWVFVLLNTLFRDVHEVFRPGFLDETLASGGTDDSALVIAAVALQLPLAMVVLSGVLRRPVARWTNIAVAALTAVSAADTWPKDADDIVFALVQLVGLLAIVALAWTWPDPGLPGGARDPTGRSSTPTEFSTFAARCNNALRDRECNQAVAARPASPRDGTPDHPCRPAAHGAAGP